MTNDMNLPAETSEGRLIVTGHDVRGRSVVTSTGGFPTRVVRANGLAVIDAWTVEEIPTSIVAWSAGEGDTSLRPPTTGVCVRIATFPPDGEVDDAAAAAYAEAALTLYGSQGKASDTQPGMHRTDTVDVVTVVKGEIWAVLDEGEVLLRPGDVLVQRGTSHGWSNRTAEPCTVITTMIPAIRD